ncbi:MAG: hypothetical protein M0R03_19500 [Novosphingobium sp.]|nr:hypothetical protein [Novosphingobium sp.]
MVKTKIEEFPCSNCKKPTPIAADRCPSCLHKFTEVELAMRKAVNGSNTSLLGGCALLIAAVALLGYCIAGGGNDSLPSEVAMSKKDPCKANDTMPSIMAANFVKRELRAPSTAKFGAHHRATITYLGDCTWRVSNHFDAQNGFGAMIRQNFSATMAYNPNTKMWSARSLQIF